MRGGLKTFRLGTKISIVVSVLLTATLLVGVAIIYQFERTRLEEDIREKTHRVLSSIQSSHTQSMLKRGDKSDDNPVIEAMNATLEAVNNKEFHMNLWLFMGPKVLAYQRKLGSDEVEPPQDDLDREAINSGELVARFVSDTLYRYSIPVILGKGDGNGYACYQCHGFDMGLVKGDPIGGFSVAYDATSDFEAFREHILKITVYLFMTVCIVWLGTIIALRRHVSAPIKLVSTTMRRIAEQQGEVAVPDPSTARSFEIEELLTAAEKFNRHSQSQLNQLRHALDEHAIVSMTDVKGVITYANDRFCALSEYSRDELVGSNHRIVKSGEHPPELFEDLWRTIARGKTWKGEIKNKKKSGSFYWVKATIVPFMDERGIPIQYIAIRTNITQQKLVEETLNFSKEELEQNVSELAASQERLELFASEQKALADELALARDAADAANSAKSEFLAAMSHEIRTPMTGILGFADMLLENTLDGGSREKVFKIKDSTRSLLRIINDILDMSKLESGKFELEYIDFHLPSVVSDVAGLLSEKRGGARAKPIKLVTDLSSDFPVGCHSDPTRLRQVLFNLVGNATKFTEVGEVRIRGRLIDTDTPSPKLHFAIQDTGIGIKPEALVDLFTEFTQADASITRKFEGTGLGLSICKKLVNLMDGEIGVESTYGEGSTFWFTLPYNEAKSDVAAPESQTLVTAKYIAARPLRILVVDDNDLNRQIIAAILTAFGHMYEMAENGAQAVEMHERGDYELILMDVRMPVMSGPAATRVIRSMDGDKRDIPIIALTADAMAEHQKDYLEAGMNAVATKPIERPALAIVMNDVMGEEVNVPQAQKLETPPPDGDNDHESDPETQAAVDDFLSQLNLDAD